MKSNKFEMSLKIPSSLVSVDWLVENLENESLLILDATIPKVGSKPTEILEEKLQIKNAIKTKRNKIESNRSLKLQLVV